MVLLGPPHLYNESFWLTPLPCSALPGPRNSQAGTAPLWGTPPPPLPATYPCAMVLDVCTLISAARCPIHQSLPLSCAFRLLYTAAAAEEVSRSTAQDSKVKGCPIHPGSVNINHSLHAQPLHHALHFTDTYFTSVFHCSSVFQLHILFQFRISPLYFICSAGCSSYQGFTFWALNQQPVPGIALHRKPLYKADSRPKSRKC